MIHSGKWIFIRFNPDNNVSKVDIEDKLAKLKETIDKCIDRIEYEENTELVEIIKLFC
jgi:protein-arginine kinase activator protein McsA